jgi:hypothetical protein
MSKKLSPLRNTPKQGATRRDLFQIGNSLLLPALLGGSQAMAATGPLQPGKDIYRSIGVEPVINCRGTFTIIGASVEHGRVSEREVHCEALHISGAAWNHPDSGRTASGELGQAPILQSRARQ